MAAQGDTASGIAEATFAGFGNPAMNETGNVAFGARLVGSTISGTNCFGIWADDHSTGTRQLVVQSGTLAIGAGDATFVKFSDPVYSGSSEVAFIGMLVHGGTTSASNDTGIWSNDNGGTLHLVAREGEQAPGCSSEVLFSQFTEIALPDQGGVVMLAKLRGCRSYNDTGIWAVDTTGTLQLIARKGTYDSISNKWIKTLKFLPVVKGLSGQTRGFSQPTGDLVYSATFEDGFSATFQDGPGIFKVVFP